MTQRSLKPSRQTRANKRLGQHFLVNQGIIAKIISSAALRADDTVLEIGPGRGALTFALARTGARVIAVEKDSALAQELREKLAQENVANVDVVTGDILTVLGARRGSTARLPGVEPQPRSDIALPKDYKVVANIPYYLTSALIRTLLEREQRPRAITLMMQKEVAQRICARNRKESILSLAVKLYADPAILFSVSRGSFAPPPAVDSAVISLAPHAIPPPVDPTRFFTLVKAGFSAPRKKLSGNFKNKLGLSENAIAQALALCGAASAARAEDLSLTQWLTLTQCLEVGPLNI